MVIRAVYDRDLHRCFGQRLRGIQAAEAGADDYDSRYRMTRHLAVMASPL